MNNLLRIMTLNEDAMRQTIFVKSREEGGINTVYDPLLGQERFQVFIHSQFPNATLRSWDFPTFSAARNFAADTFRDWDFLQWDFQVDRPCAKGGSECGSNKEGCSTCSTRDPNEAHPCTGCKH